jgi:hypothetical protein
METTGGRPTNDGVRLRMRWTKAAVLAALVTAGLFAFDNGHGCWFFRNQLRDLVLFSFPFAWLLLFFGLRTRGRLILLLVALIAIVTTLGTGFWGMSEMNAAAEVAAFQALHQMQFGLNTYRVEHQLREYPDTMPSMTLTPSAQKYYRFEYIPSRSASGEILGYTIQATPARRDCEFHRSFTITDDGRVFWTLEPRAAILSDVLYK